MNLNMLDPIEMARRDLMMRRAETQHARRTLDACMLKERVAAERLGKLVSVAREQVGGLAKACLSPASYNRIDVGSVPA